MFPKVKYSTLYFLQQPDLLQARFADLWVVKRTIIASQLVLLQHVFVVRFTVPLRLMKLKTKAWFRRRSTHVPNLTDELSTTKERRLNQFGTAVLVWCGKSVKFDRVCQTFVELNLGSTHGTPSESDVAPVSLQSRTYSVTFGT